MSLPAIQMQGVHLWFGHFHALRGIDLEGDRAEERVVICGPSGSGKSTLIRCINRPGAITSAGRIVVDGIKLTNAAATHQRGAPARSAWCSSSSICSRI